MSRSREKTDPGRGAGRARAVLLAAAVLIVPACGSSHSSGTSASSPATGQPGIQVSPSTATVVLGSDQSFTAALSGLADADVVWSVNGIPGGNPSVGTIRPTAGGAVYSAAAVPSPDMVTVAATSRSDSSVTGQSSVTVLYPDDASRAQTLPIHLGTSGGNSSDFSVSGATTTCCSGTLGALVSRGGAFFILSNNHVLDKSGNGNPGDPVTQPGLTDNGCRAGTLVATLAQSAPLTTSNVDAALALVAPGAVDLSGAILDFGAAGPTNIAPASPSSTLADPAAALAAGTRVAKTGRSTGLTCASIAAVSADIQVDYPASCDGPTEFSVTFRNQILISGDNFSEAGDSGSLIVTVDAARPLGLLYAGSASMTAANPIADVLGALADAGSGEQPRIVGGPDHPVSCAAMATRTTPSSAPLPEGAPSPEEFARATQARDRFGRALLDDPAVASLGIGTSADRPAEGALLVYLRGRPAGRVPPAIGGVRTRIVAAETPVAADALERARRSKDSRVAELLRRPGVLGVGVGLSKDAPGEPAIVLFVEKDAGFSGVEADLDGVRTQVREGERFRSFGWGRSGRSRTSGCCGEK
jgi:hypothetical protein